MIRYSRCSTSLLKKNLTFLGPWHCPTTKPKVWIREVWLLQPHIHVLVLSFFFPLDLATARTESMEGFPMDRMLVSLTWRSNSDTVCGCQIALHGLLTVLDRYIYFDAEIMEKSSSHSPLLSFHFSPALVVLLSWPHCCTSLRVVVLGKFPSETK